MLTWFNNFKVGTKIGFGNGLILVLLVAVAAIAYFGLSVANTNFAEYRRISQQSNELSSVQTQILSTRVAARIFFGNGEEASAKTTIERIDAVAKAIDSTLLLMTSDSDVAAMNKAKENIVEYRDAFQKTVDLYSQANEFNATLNALGPQTEAGLTKILTTAFDDNNAAAAKAAAVAMREQLLARIYASRYMATPTQENADRATAQINAFGTALDALDASVFDGGSKGEIGTVRDQMAGYGATLANLIETYTARAEVISGTLDHLGPEIADNAEAVKAQKKAEQDELGLSTTRGIEQVIVLSFALSLGAVLIGLATSFIIAGLISKPINRMTGTMNKMAEGEYNVEVPARGRKDEIGVMAGAVEVFRQNGLKVAEMTEAEAARVIADQKARTRMMQDLQTAFGEVVDAAVAGDFSRRVAAEFPDAELNALAGSVNNLVETVDRGLEETGSVLASLADTDLTRRVEGQYAGAFEKLKTDTNAVADKLTEIVGQLKETSHGLRNATSEILAGANDLSERTTKQAATIEETSAAMEQLAATVAQNAERAEVASVSSQSMSKSAEEGGEVMRSANQAMEQITHSSAKISNIIGMIDDIAFQTNLLALNASVEAARAGEAGKGFAVVAIEVRRLAQSAAEASSEVKALIEQSATEVSGGSKLVASAAEKLATILAAVKANNGLMDGIAKESREQASAIKEVNVAVRQMDEMTQHNAALVEEINAAIEQTETQATDLDRIVDIFQIVDKPHAQTAPAATTPARKQPGTLKKIASGAKALLTRGNAAIDKDWAAF